MSWIDPDTGEWVDGKTFCHDGKAVANHGKIQTAKLTNRKMARVAEDREQISKVRATAGRRGAAKRWSKSDGKNGTLLNPSLNPSLNLKEEEKKTVAPSPFLEIMKRVFSRINELTGVQYEADSKYGHEFLGARLKEGRTEEQCLAVVEHRWKLWGNDENMRRSFNPTTLFRETNFDRYLAETSQSPRRPMLRPDVALKQRLAAQGGK